MSLYCNIVFHVISSNNITKTVCVVYSTPRCNMRLWKADAAIWLDIDLDIYDIDIDVDIDIDIDIGINIYDIDVEREEKHSLFIETNSKSFVCGVEQ